MKKIKICALSNAKVYAPVNLDRIQHWIDTGRLKNSPDEPITAHELVKSNCVHGIRDGIKLLADVSTVMLMEYSI